MLTIYIAHACFLPTEGGDEFRKTVTFTAENLDAACADAERFQALELQRLGEGWEAECLSLREIDVHPIDGDGRCMTLDARVVTLCAKSAV